MLDWEVDFPLAGYAGPVSTLGPGALTSSSASTKPLLRIRPHAKKTFGAATVAGYAGPGFHNWPPGHIPQDNGSETASPHPAPCQKDVR